MGEYGLSDFRSSSALSSVSEDKALLSFRCPARLPEACGPAVFIHPQRAANGEPFLLVFPTCHGYRLHFPGLAEFSLEGDAALAAPQPGASAGHIEAAFLSIVIALWLEQRGLRCLHAAAVAYHGQALALLAESGQGKSSLAAACLAAGATLLSDDIVPVNERFWAHPGYPRLGLWPGQAAALGLPPQAPLAEAAGDKLRLPLAKETFHNRPLPLAGLFLLQRLDPPADLPGPRLERVSGQEALIALVRYSFLPRLSAALGLQRARLASLARLAVSVPVYRLVYPSGVERLGEVVQAVLSILPGKD
jgi:hypothetical protein